MALDCYADDFGNNSSWPCIFSANTLPFSVCVSENMTDLFWAKTCPWSSQLGSKQFKAPTEWMPFQSAGSWLSGGFGREEVTDTLTREKLLNFWALIDYVFLDAYVSSLFFSIQHSQSCEQ